MDLDPTGQANALKFADRYINLLTIQLPDWLSKRNDWRGNPCKDIKDFINIAGKDQDQTLHQFNILRRRAFPMKFWQKIQKKNKEGKRRSHITSTWRTSITSFNPRVVYHRFGVPHARRLLLRQDPGKRVDLIHPEQVKKLIKRFTKEWIRSKGLMDEVAVLNKINSSNQIGENNLQELRRSSSALSITAKPPSGCISQSQAFASPRTRSRRWGMTRCPTTFWGRLT
jgi:hypothetical protein